MTQLLRDPGNISNWFDRVLAGIGERGSSLCDVDRLVVTHDGVGIPRFLFQELKRPNESLDPAHAWMLRDLSALPNTTVWIATQHEDFRGVCVQQFMGPNRGLFQTNHLALGEYREWFARWWNQPANVDTRRDIVWAEYVKQDPGLRAFIAQVVQPIIEERDHWKGIALKYWRSATPKEQRTFWPSLVADPIASSDK